MSRSTLPVGAMVAAGSLVLAPVAVAAEPPAQEQSSPVSALDEAPVAGQVAATASQTESESVRETRTATATARKTLTKKVKASASASASATRTRTREAEVTVTRYAATGAEAQAEATTVAEQAASDEAHDRASDAAASAATKAARSTARKAARTKANHAARKKFGTVVLRQAAAQRGKPYRYGATGPGSFDCSGYVGYVMKRAGVNKLPRTSGAITARADRVAKKNKKRGDLISFRSGGRVYHVGIYAGHGKIWHAPGSGRSVTKAKIWTSNYTVGRLPS